MLTLTYEYKLKPTKQQAEESSMPRDVASGIVIKKRAVEARVALRR